jgi:hypothetical protein
VPIFAAKSIVSSGFPVGIKTLFFEQDDNENVIADRIKIPLIRPFIS